MLVSAVVEKSKEDFETTRYGLWELEGASGRFGYCCLKECYHYQQICSLKNNHSKCTCAWANMDRDKNDRYWCSQFWCLLVKDVAIFSFWCYVKSFTSYLYLELMFGICLHGAYDQRRCFWYMQLFLLEASTLDSCNIM